MNNKTYANYLMHGRTKGSRNGISTTKGYTAVGQKAKGKLINGKYVYDTPVAYGNNTEMVRDGKVVYESPSVPAGVASYPKKKSDWAKEAASYDNHVTTYPKQGYDALMMEKRNAWLAEKAKAQGASNNWQQQGNYARAGGEAVNRAVSGQTSRVHIKLNSAQENQGIAGMTAKARRDLSKAGATKGDAQQAALEQWKKQNQNAIAAKKTADAKAQAAKQPTNIGASQSADLARWSQQNRNNIAASKKAAKDAELQDKLWINKTLAEARKNTTRNWQGEADRVRSNSEVHKKVASGQSNTGYTSYVIGEKPTAGIVGEYYRNNQKIKNLVNRVYAEQNKKAQEATEKAKQSASYNKMSSTQKNAMQNDPRYSKASTFNKSGIMKSDRIPYSAQMEKSTNRQELADAIGKNKKFISDMKESALRNSRSDLGNALADAKEDAKNAFKSLKNKFKKKKKK